MNLVVLGDNLEFLKTVESESVRLVYIDPPFNTRTTRKGQRIQAVRDDQGDRIGFGDRKYRSELAPEAYSFDDKFSGYLSFLIPRLVEARRVLSPDGSFFFHIDYREAHYCKVLLDTIFGRDSFMNEIIWAYDYGARSKKRWSTKHDTIFWYSKDPSNYVFNYEDMERIPYMAPGLVSKEKAERGKTPTDVWWHTIVPTNGKERTGYPTQKPLGVLKRIVSVHSCPGDTVLDFFAGSGTTGAAAQLLGREFVLVDNNFSAVEIMKDRLSDFDFLDMRGSNG